MFEAPSISLLIIIFHFKLVYSEQYLQFKIIDLKKLSSQEGYFLHLSVIKILNVKKSLNWYILPFHQTTIYQPFVSPNLGFCVSMMPITKNSIAFGYHFPLESEYALPAKNRISLIHCHTKPYTHLGSF